MNIDLIPVGDDPPHSVNVIIEVPVGGEPVKYEFDKKSGAIFVDRILHTPMRYPANYGFIPHTLSRTATRSTPGRGALALHPGSVVRVRPIAVLLLEDEAGGDEKLLAVPATRPSLIMPRSRKATTCRRSCSSRSSISSPTTRISSPRNGCGSATGASRDGRLSV